jgi:hypothetical protein
MPVAWVTIVVGDLNHYLVGAQVVAINTAALASGQTDRFTRVMTDVVNRIRNKIETCSGNQLSATPLTIPPSLRAGACLLILEGMQGSIPALKLTEDQVRQIDRYQKDLDLIAACDLTVEEPPDPLDPPNAQSGGAIEVVSNTPRQATRDKMKGL